MKRMFLIRGLPGSGKTTLAYLLVNQPQHVHLYSADDYMVSPIDGQYAYDPLRLAEVHKLCQADVLLSATGPCQADTIVVHNTFTQNWEMLPYKKIAKQHGYEVFVIRCENQYGNIHGVPTSKVVQMQSRFEDNQQV